jgi:hypothetical protein
VLIRIDETSIYNTETGGVIERATTGTLFLDGWDEGNKCNVMLLGDSANILWEKLSGAAAAHARALDLVAGGGDAEEAQARAADLLRFYFTRHPESEWGEGNDKDMRELVEWLVAAARG